VPWTSATSDGDASSLTSVLVLGGSSAVGAFAILQLRKFLPASTVILTTCSTRNHDLVKSLGANNAFDPTSATLLDDIRAASPSKGGVPAILDCVNGAAIRHDTLEALDAHGSKLFVEVPSGTNIAPEQIPEGITAKKAGAYAIIEKMGMVEGGSGLRDLMVAFEGLLERKEIGMPLKVDVVGQGLESIEQGLDRLKKGVSATKLVVTL